MRNTHRLSILTALFLVAFLLHSCTSKIHPDSSDSWYRINRPQKLDGETEALLSIEARDCQYDVPIIAASILVLPESGGMQEETDRSGKVEFRLSPGMYQLKLIYTGFPSITTRPIRLDFGTVTMVEFCVHESNVMR